MGGYLQDRLRLPSRGLSGYRIQYMLRSGAGQLMEAVSSSDSKDRAGDLRAGYIALQVETERGSHMIFESTRRLKKTLPAQPLENQ